MLKNLKLILLLSVAMFIFLGIGNAVRAQKAMGTRFTNGLRLRKYPAQTPIRRT